VERQSRYSQRKLRVSTGDRVLLVTDGVLETPGPDGRLFRRERVLEVLQEHAELDCCSMGRALLEALRRHANADELTHDDVTLLLMEFVDNTEGPAIWRMLKNRILRPKGNSHLSIFEEPPRVPVTKAD